MAAGIKFSVKKEGPFFQLKDQPLKEAAVDMTLDFAKEGQAQVQSQLRPGHGVVTGGYAASIFQEGISIRRNQFAASRVSGARDRHTGIVGSWLEGGQRRGQATRFKGYAMFRKATQTLNRLARQIAGKQYARAVKRLT